MNETEEKDQIRYAQPITQDGNSVIAHRGKLLIVVGVFLISLTYLGINAFDGASAYYMTVGELVQQGDEIHQKNLRVNGKLIHDSFVRDNDGTSIYFALTDGDAAIKVTYHGLVPDLFFNEHSEILVEGTYTAEDLFEAEAIIVKCPSKYQPEEKETSNQT